MSGKNATDNKSTACFHRVIELVFDVWRRSPNADEAYRDSEQTRSSITTNISEEKRIDTASVGNRSTSATCILVLRMLNMFIEKYDHIAQIVAKKKLKILPGARSVHRRSVDVGLVVNDGNLYRKKYKGW